MLKGFLAFFRSFNFMARHGMLKWYFVPLLLYFLVATVLSISVFKYIKPLVQNLIQHWLKINLAANENVGFWELVLSWIKSGFSFMASWLVVLLLWYFMLRISKYLILIILSPLLAYLSEKTEELLTGKTYNFNLWGLVSDAFRGIVISIRNIVLETLFIAIGVLISFFFPFLSPLVWVCLFLLNCYFMGFSMFDYCLERQKLSVSASVKVMRQNRFQVIGLGLAYNLVSLIPLADWVVAPVNGAVGATLSWHHKS